ncbi:hypothetical protein TcasGA2_TC034638 [Tribolium castaneum]|uniref:Uncharacterized protein n=1 Tax=Tribolium castaneum TaxID=7070 RepID=A0A139WJN0_TRICA|nr:hypothetical protein TcasGA2_TC034638 [Tribolium castaneum]
MFSIRRKIQNTSSQIKNARLGRVRSGQVKKFFAKSQIR